MMLRAIYHTPGSFFAMLQYDLLFAMSQGFTLRSFAVLYGLYYIIGLLLFSTPCSKLLSGVELATSQ